MHLRILMIGSDEAYLATERDFLKEKGIRVYTSLAAEHLDALISETDPDLVFLNYREPGIREIDLYQKAQGYLRSICKPVIFTLSEDTAYLTSRNRPATRPQKHHISDNISDAIRHALSAAGSSRRFVPQSRKTVFFHTLPASA